MPLEIVTVPCLSDNYAYLVKGPDGIVLIDAPEAEPIIDALESRGWSLGGIMVTHHHYDHVQAVDTLRAKYGCPVMGPSAEADKMPKLDIPLGPGFAGGNGDGVCEVLHVPGHTLGHVAYHYPMAKAVFSADSLMALGCGRLFEGTPEMMWATMKTFKALPPDTIVYSGHEYTASNAKFALTIEPDNPALAARVAQITKDRAAGKPTAQVALSVELETNPFLRADLPEVKATLGMSEASDAEVFAEIRARKDRF